MDHDPSFLLSSLSQLAVSTAVEPPASPRPQTVGSMENSPPKPACQPPPLPQVPANMRHFHSDSHLRDSTHLPSAPPSQGGISSRRRSEESIRDSPQAPLPLLHVPKARPSTAIDLLPSTPPTLSRMPHPHLDPLTLTCPECCTPTPLTADDQKTAVCQTCLTNFKSGERKPRSEQRRGSVLTSFPALVANASMSDDDETEGQQNDMDGDKDRRKPSLVASMGRVFGILRGGSESSLESWGESRSGGSSVIERPGSRSLNGSWSTS